jgi:hypothetical protein
MPDSTVKDTNLNPMSRLPLKYQMLLLKKKIG